MPVTLTTAELAAVVAGSAALASLDAAALSRLAVTAIGKKLGVKPSEIRGFSAAADGNSDGS